MWIWNADKTQFVNMAHVTKMLVAYPGYDGLWENRKVIAVEAGMHPGIHTLHVGTEAECKAFLVALAQKLEAGEQGENMAGGTDSEWIKSVVLDRIKELEGRVLELEDKLEAERYGEEL